MKRPTLDWAGTRINGSLLSAPGFLGRLPSNFPAQPRMAGQLDTMCEVLVSNVQLLVTLVFKSRVKVRTS